jgi:hypothetical protein
MRRCASLIVLCLVLTTGFAQSYKLHSVYIYGFTRYVIWPDEHNQGDFEIMVLGDSPLLDELKSLAAAKKVGDRAIKITRISSPAEIKKCNILFIPASSSSRLGEVVSKVSNQSTLIITEETGLGTKGSHINFIQKDGKLAFELNQAAATKHNLKISNTLTGMAILI